ncbi:hypothetical protein Tco_0932471 [Tanacetum coccineum]
MGSKSPLKCIISVCIWCVCVDEVKEYGVSDISSKPDISKASSAGGKLHILKPSCERNGITPTPKKDESKYHILLSAKPLAKRVASPLHDGGKKDCNIFYGNESFRRFFGSTKSKPGSRVKKISG